MVVMPLMSRRRTLRNRITRIAPTRFILFFALLAAGIAAATFVSPWWLSVMLGFDLAAVTFVAGCYPLLGKSAPAMRESAIHEDANRSILLVLVFAIVLVILVAVGSQLGDSGNRTGVDIALVIGTLLVAWVFGNCVYALHYAHLFYSRDDGGRDRAGIKFPGAERNPSFAAFLYFAFTLGCTLAVSDADVTSRHIRQVVTAHAVAGFIYNVGVFALTVNILAGG
jgi:uncharacterized membrane protein